MTKYTSLLFVGLFCLSFLAASPTAKAGNPDRQGEAGAYELIMNPWARSAGLNGLVAARVTGVEALRFNPAGICRISGKTEVALGHTQYMAGTGISLNAAGLVQKIGDNGALGVELMSVGFGDIPLTTVDQPGGITTFSPSFFNIGLSYGYVFKDEEGNEKVSVGVGVRVVSESIANASATGVGFDAGVQYVTGVDRQIKFGVALRNIGTKMSYSGDGLAFVGVAPNNTTALTVNSRGAGYELPSLLHIGLSYDFYLGSKINRLTAVGNFTSNSFSRDQYGVGVEYAFKEMFMARTAFRYEGDMYNAETSSTASGGLTAGVTAELPLRKGSAKKIAFDYAYEYTQVFKGTHSLTLKLKL